MPSQQKKPDKIEIAITRIRNEFSRIFKLHQDIIFGDSIRYKKGAEARAYQDACKAIKNAYEAAKTNLIRSFPEGTPKTTQNTAFTKLNKLVVSDLISQYESHGNRSRSYWVASQLLALDIFDIFITSNTDHLTDDDLQQLLIQAIQKNYPEYIEFLLGIQRNGKPRIEMTDAVKNACVLAFKKESFDDPVFAILNEILLRNEIERKIKTVFEESREGGYGSDYLSLARTTILQDIAKYKNSAQLPQVGITRFMELIDQQIQDDLCSVAYDCTQNNFINFERIIERIISTRAELFPDSITTAQHREKILSLLINMIVYASDREIKGFYQQFLDSGDLTGYKTNLEKLKKHLLTTFPDPVDQAGINNIFLEIESQHTTLATQESFFNEAKAVIIDARKTQAPNVDSETVQNSFLALREKIISDTQAAVKMVATAPAAYRTANQSDSNALPALTKRENLTNRIERVCKKMRTPIKRCVRPSQELSRDTEVKKLLMLRLIEAEKQDEIASKQEAKTATALEQLETALLTLNRKIKEYEIRIQRFPDTDKDAPRRLAAAKALKGYIETMQIALANNSQHGVVLNTKLIDQGYGLISGRLREIRKVVKNIRDTEEKKYFETRKQTIKTAKSEAKKTKRSPASEQSSTRSEKIKKLSLIRDQLDVTLGELTKKINKMNQYFLRGSVFELSTDKSPLIKQKQAVEEMLKYINATLDQNKSETQQGETLILPTNTQLPVEPTKGDNSFTKEMSRFLAEIHKILPQSATIAAAPATQSPR